MEHLAKDLSPVRAPSLWVGLPSRRDKNLKDPSQNLLFSMPTKLLIRNIIKTLTDYIQLKNFKLSAVRLQPSMDKMDKDDNYLYTKTVRLIKRIYKTGD